MKNTEIYTLHHVILKSSSVLPSCYQQKIKYKLPAGPSHGPLPQVTVRPHWEAENYFIHPEGGNIEERQRSGPTISACIQTVFP
jgi:hypothetical protein